MRKPSAKELLKYFRMDRKIKGLVFVKDSGQGGRYKKGTRAGSINKSGHLMVFFEGKYYQETHVIWAMHYGKWPNGSISHFNNDLLDSRPENLYLSSGKKFRKTHKKEITIERLNFLFRYDAQTGNLIRRVNKPPNTKAGEIATKLNSKGYLIVRVDGFNIRAHWVVWAINKGNWPEKNLDHINGIKSDNRIENLREASRSENAQNCLTRKDNKTGIRGVKLRKDTGKYQSYIIINNKQISLGCYDKIKDAMKVRKEAEEKYHPFRRTI